MLIARDIANAIDPVAFAEACDDFTCDKWQADFLRSTSKRALLNCSRQSGKTESVSIKAAHVACYVPESLTIIAAPSNRQSGELLLRVRKKLKKHGDAVPALKRDNVFSVELTNGSRILALPGDDEGTNIRGLANARLILVDEASRVSDSLIAALRPMLATNKDGELVMLSTPAGKRGKWYEYWHNGDPTWSRIRASAADCPRISKEFLAAELKDLGPTMFEQEYNLAFLDSGMSAFPTQLIEAMFNDDSVRPLWQ